MGLEAETEAAALAPGYRFHPSDEELVRYYLTRKASGKPFRFQPVREIDVYKFEPWDLSCYSSLKTRDLEWYFFSPVDRKYGSGCRLNRATAKGYWKATGKDRPVQHKSLTIGMKKTLVFHKGRAPDGERTNWVMHEYRLVHEESRKAGATQNAFVLCRIFQKSGLGPPGRNRYAPFIEEEWNDGSALFVPGEEADDVMANGDEEQEGCNELDQDMNQTPFLMENPVEARSSELLCSREGSEDIDPLSLGQNKWSKHDDPDLSLANGSEDSTTTSQDPAMTMMPTTVSSALMEFPLLESVEGRESQPLNPSTFDSSDLEKAIPPGYLKFISNLENEMLDVTMEKETLKIEVMRAQTMLNILQSRIDLLSQENEDLRSSV